MTFSSMFCVCLLVSFLATSHAFSVRAPTRALSKGGDMSMRWGLKGAGTSNKPTGDLEEGQRLADTVPFELRGFSLPTVVFSVGVLLTGSSFAGYFVNNDSGGDGSLSSLGFVYGIPVFLIGLSLFYAEIKPVEVVSTPAGETAWEAKGTDTMQKIYQDVTRHRYGDDAHLDSTLEALGLKLPQKKFPKMQTIELNETADKELEFTMTFQSAETPFKVWNDPDRVQRYTRFFGPGVVATVEKRDAEKRLVALKLRTASDEAVEQFLMDYNSSPAAATEITEVAAATEITEAAAVE